VFLNGDIPQKIGCDNQFNVKPFHELCNVYKVRPIFSLPHNPQTNGFVENKNKQIKGYIYHHINKYYDTSNFKYYDTLNHIAYSINNTKHSVTKKTPNEIHRGRVLPLPADYIEVSDVPVSFDKAFPVLENSYNPKQIIQKRKGKVQQLNIHNENSDENKVIEEYNKAAQTVYSQRVMYVREKIHNEAKKRELLYKQKNTVQRFSTSSLVKVRTYLTVDDGHKIQPIQLRLVSQYNENQQVAVLKNPLFRVTSGKGFDGIAHVPAPSTAVLKSQTSWNLPENMIPVFRIKEIVVFPNKTKKYYRLVSFDNKYQVEHMVTKRPDKYSQNFTQQMLHHAEYKDVNNSAKYRPEYIHTLNSVVTDINIAENSENTESMSNDDFKLKSPGSQYDYIANPTVQQLSQTEFDTLWEIIEKKDKFDTLSGNEIITFAKYKRELIQVSGLLKSFVKSGKYKNHFYVTLYDGSTIVQDKRLVLLHTNKNSMFYAKHGTVLESKANEYVFRYPYHIRRLFDL
jgi:hypothetical protein